MRRNAIRILGVAVVVAIVLAVYIPMRPSPHYEGNQQVYEAVYLLRALAAEVESFHDENDRLPRADELGVDVSVSTFVERVEGDNPYFAVMKSEGIYPDVAGRTLGWMFDPATGDWDRCTHGTVPARFKPIDCREAR